MDWVRLRGGCERGLIKFYERLGLRLGLGVGVEFCVIPAFQLQCLRKDDKYM